jgi:DNA-directed RNA polymerase specialized sigma subunit
MELRHLRYVRTVHRREPTVNEFATALDRGPEFVIEALVAVDSRHVLWLDSPAAEEARVRDP